jgi:nucleoside-diphosphate-sugar epimerase
MRVFLTGASGFIGQAVLAELKAAGHEVLGLARNDDNAAKLAAAGAAVHRGDLNDVESLAEGAAACDGTIHCAFIHDFSQYAQNIAIDRRAVEAMLATLEGTGKPFILTSGTLMAEASGEVTEEQAAAREGLGAARGATELLVEAYADRGVRAMIVRLPQVHDEAKQGFVSLAIQVAQAKGVSAYVGDGENRWAAAHVSDVARLYRLALEHGNAGARYHAVGESGVRMRDIAEAIGNRLETPVLSIAADEAAAHFGFLGAFAVRDAPTSSRLTQERLGWTPVGPGLLTDIANLRVASPQGEAAAGQA